MALITPPRSVVDDDAAVAAPAEAVTPNGETSSLAATSNPGTDVSLTVSR